LGGQIRRRRASRCREAAAGGKLDTAEGKGIDTIPSNDFSLYDHVLDTAVMVGAVPAVYGWNGGPVALDTCFAMARGSTGDEAHADCGHWHHHGHGVPALEMTKWFDTNYHYMVPELGPDQAFALTANKPLDAFIEAKTLGIHTRPVILGPVSFLKLAREPRKVLRRSACWSVCFPSMRRCWQNFVRQAPTGCRSMNRALCSISRRKSRWHCSMPIVRCTNSCLT